MPGQSLVWRKKLNCKELNLIFFLCAIIIIIISNLNGCG